MRLVFAGTPAPAVPSLSALLASPRHEVVAVVTRPDAPSGRGRTLRRSPVGALADGVGVPVSAGVGVGVAPSPTGVGDGVKFFGSSA